jgi:hypothetical protein
MDERHHEVGELDRGKVRALGGLAGDDRGLGLPGSARIPAAASGDQAEDKGQASKRAARAGPDQGRPRTRTDQPASLHPAASRQQRASMITC